MLRGHKIDQSTLTDVNWAIATGINTGLDSASELRKRYNVSFTLVSKRMRHIGTTESLGLQTIVGIKAGTDMSHSTQRKPPHYMSSVIEQLVNSDAESNHKSTICAW